MNRIKQMISDPHIGLDAWYDSYLDEVIFLMIEFKKSGEIQAFFEMFPVLTTDEKIKFLEAITEIHETKLLPIFLTILSHPDTPIEIAEPIIDGLRGWDLNEEDKLRVQDHARTYYGKSKLLDFVIESSILND